MSRSLRPPGRIETPFAARQQRVDAGGNWLRQTYGKITDKAIDATAFMAKAAQAVALAAKVKPIAI